MKKLEASNEAINLAASVIRRGGLVAFPTETVYGLGADALNEYAVAKIFDAKKRPKFDPLIVHIADTEWLYKLADKVDERAERLIERFWPGPLTLVLRRRKVVPDIVTAGLDTVAIRMPSHPVAIELIKRSRTPISAPSANLFGYISPTTAEHVERQLGDSVDIILDGGRCPVGVESTIISLVGEHPVLLRPGGLPIEEIEKVVGRVKIREKHGRIEAPGQLKKHYSPKTPVRIIRSLDEIEPGKDVGVLLFSKPDFKIEAGVIEILSEDGDLVEAAANLFSAMHRLDMSGVRIIYAQEVPDVGLGRAIMDRLRKASGRGG
jgi:L-threonylcarbamoyladenylate synthase